MHRLWVSVVAIVLIVSLTITIIITAKENQDLEKSNEILKDKTDSLSLIHSKIKTDLNFTRRQLDSLLEDTTDFITP